MKHSFSVTSNNVSLVVHSTKKLISLVNPFHLLVQKITFHWIAQDLGTLDLKSTVSPKVLVIDMMSLKNWKCTQLLISLTCLYLVVLLV